MKGIVLAGGAGSRLYPVTRVLSKQLLPVYDKPMIYYPLSVLMLAGLREVLIISTPHDLPRFEELLGSGERLGMRFAYLAQPEPKGIAQAFLLGAEFLGTSPVCLVLGDNVLHGSGLTGLLARCVTTVEHQGGAVIATYVVKDPERYGVVTFGRGGAVVGLEEKPARPRSNHAVVGLYFYDNEVISIAAGLTPSGRGELEITDVNNFYIREGKISWDILDGWWTDAGTFESLARANELVIEGGCR